MTNKLSEHIEETLLKFFYGECSIDELKRVHRELCDDDACHEYLQKMRELLSVLREAEEAGEREPASWEEINGAFEQVSKLLGEGGK